MTIPAAVLIVALLTCVAGITMVFMQIKDAGTVDLRTPFLDGTVKSGFVGISLIFLSIVLSIFSLVVVARRDMEIKVGNMSVRLRGPFSRKVISEVISTVQSGSLGRPRDHVQQDDGQRSLEGALSDEESS